LPTYEYACTACGHRLEAVQRFSDDPLTECPECQGALRKVLSAPSIVLKGSGFYKTDSRAAAGANGKNGKNGKSTESAGDSSGSSSSSSSDSDSSSSSNGADKKDTKTDSAASTNGASKDAKPAAATTS
jgi:putative FmdB family regulatory protein